jgi:hypothetical protein
MFNCDSTWAIYTNGNLEVSGERFFVGFQSNYRITDSIVFYKNENVFDIRYFNLDKTYCDLVLYDPPSLVGGSPRFYKRK